MWILHLYTVVPWADCDTSALAVLKLNSGSNKASDYNVLVVFGSGFLILFKLVIADGWLCVKSSWCNWEDWQLLKHFSLWEA